MCNISILLLNALSSVYHSNIPWLHSACIPTANHAFTISIAYFHLPSFPMFKVKLLILFVLNIYVYAYFIFILKSKMIEVI